MSVQPSTSSPTDQPVTPSLTSSTIPAASAPGIAGNGAVSAPSPAAQEPVIPPGVGQRGRFAARTGGQPATRDVSWLMDGERSVS